MSFPAYDDTRHSGIDWVGEIPMHWEIASLKRGYAVTLGKMLQSSSKTLEDEIEKIAAQGLRTLVYGYKEMSTTYPNPKDISIEEVESDIILTAVTGVEDILQENVKECIEDFRDAGIKVWMLTGDKGTTA